MTAAVGCAALAAAERELPVVTDPAAALDAQALLEACHAAGALEWSLALACSLDNTLLLAGARAAADDGCPVHAHP